jgi:hypothetical protein
MNLPGRGSLREISPTGLSGVIGGTEGQYQIYDANHVLKMTIRPGGTSPTGYVDPSYVSEILGNMKQGAYAMLGE